MELITKFIVDGFTNLVASVVWFGASLLANILAHDICVSADRTCTKIIHQAARRLAPFDQEFGEFEMLGDLSERDTVYDKYRHAIGCYLAAGRMRRRAQTITLAINFRVPGVGAVPLTLKLKPVLMSVIFAAVGEKMPGPFRRASIAGVVLYIFAKLGLSAHRLGPGMLERFVDQFQHYKTWEYECRVMRKGLDLNVGKLLKLLLVAPKRFPAVAEKFIEIFRKKE